MSSPSTTSPAAADLAGRVARARRAFDSGRTKRREWRMEQLRNIVRLLDEREADIAAALADDLGRDSVEAWLGDIASTKGEAAFAIRHLRRWMRRKRTGLSLNQLPGSAWVQYEPLGVVLVIGPWNYPVYLTLAPVVAALAAGNSVVIKPSEFAPATSRLLARLLPEYLDPEAVVVVEGDGAVTQALLAQGFDHAVFTGGTDIGRKIMAGAAPQLTPVTLELGGKSPVIVAADADLDVAARRIVWVKLLNSGQTCISPDYVLADHTVVDALVDKIVATVGEFRRDGADGPGLRIVNERQFDRLAQYLAGTKGTVVLGGGSSRSLLTIEPTVVVSPDPAEDLMREEIFGPILPVLSYETPADAIAFVNARPKPLAVYVFAKSAAVQRVLVDGIPAGGAVINHVAMHCLAPQLPFGGVGPSGMGAYHGRWGFETLSHRKAVLRKTFRPDPRLVYPPYSARDISLMRKIF